VRSGSSVHRHERAPDRGICPDVHVPIVVGGERIGGDIYIHQADTILGVGLGAVVFALFGALIAVLLVVLWQTWVIIGLKRKARGS
jgi:hypothetical protein